MQKNLLLASIFLYLTLAIAGCNNNKIACPTYADSFPEKKAKKGKSGAAGEAPIPKPTKARSGVMPSDGRGSRTKVPN